MLDYIVIKSLRMCLAEARRQAVDSGIESGVVVVEAKNIPKDGNTQPLDEEHTYEEMIVWGARNNAKCNFVRDYTRSSHEDRMQNKPAVVMGWGPANIAFGYTDFFYGQREYGYSIAFGVLADTSSNGEAILKIILETFEKNKLSA